MGTKLKEPVRIRDKKLANGNSSLFLDVYFNGKRKREYLKLYLIPERNKVDKEANANTLKLANAVKAKRIVEIQNNEYGFKTKTGKEKTNLIQYVHYLADQELAKTGNKRSYYYTFNSLAKHLNTFAGEKATFANVDTNFVKNFITYLRTAKNFNYEKKEGEDKKALSPNTQHNLFKKFAFVLKKAVKSEIVLFNPIDKLEGNDKPKGEDSAREFLTITELKKLIGSECKNDTVKRAFLFCCLCGLRYSDVSKLTWDNFYIDNDGEMMLRMRIQKAKRNEDIPISKEAIKWLPDKKEGAGKIFDLPKNDNANKLLSKWCKTSGITKKISFHCSRHTSATLNLSLGVPIETVSKLLGHKKIATTQIYAKIIDEKKKEAIRKQEGLFD
ncbi:MAG: site-specific integrase [Prevotellaceae bacterium]|jgi:integrase|nr:site-specific integrase [Prevotellaceae bacterium]